MKQEQFIAERVKVFSKKYAGVICVWLAWALFFALSFANIASVEQFSASISLRYDSGLSAQVAKDARRKAIEKQSSYWPTFWSEASAGVTLEKFSAQVKCLYYSGDASLVLPAKILNGYYPGDIEEYACAISSKLAWDLFKDQNYIGATIKIDGVDYIVKGIFESTELTVIASLGEKIINDFKWQVVEIPLSSGEISKTEAIAFAKDIGLGEPDMLIMGGSISTLVKFMAFLPLALLLVYIFVQIIAGIKFKNEISKRILIFAIILALVLSLPLFLNLLPPEFVPSKWSDFGFWAELFKTMKLDLRKVLYLTPLYKDVLVKEMVIVQSLYTLVLMCLSVVLCFFFKTGMQPEKQSLRPVLAPQPKDDEDDEKQQRECLNGVEYAIMKS